ncbi:unnamed protein product [Rhizoctonia solani]|nr:unnamed protein product [Rhizoctonia solani]
MTCISPTTSLTYYQQTCTGDDLNPFKHEGQPPAQLYQQWKKLHDQLSCTINDYVNACTALAAAASPVYQSSIESLFANIDKELNHLSQVETKLASGRRILSRTQLPSWPIQL